MKKFLCLFVSLFVSATLFADQVTEQQALQKAKQFMKGKSLSVANTKSFSRGSSKDADAFYIFNAENNGGFVIVSGDDQTTDILGYSDHGNINTSKLPDNLEYLLNYYNKVINSLGEETGVKRNRQLTRSPQSTEKAEIAPLIQTEWGQSWPYNQLCPLYKGERCVTGCVATAMAQLMYYHKWPEGGTTVIPSYELTDSSDPDNNLTLEPLPNTTFDWDKMLFSYPWDVEADEHTEAVAKLMQYCGQSVHMAYSPVASAANSIDAANALKEYFDYHKGLRLISRNTYTDVDWENIIYDELASGRPVYYDGNSMKEGGHAWVCDGYQDGYFHMNWGWKGDDNGFFLLSILDSYGSESKYWGFWLGQAAIIGIKPSDGSDIGFSFDDENYHYTIVGEQSVSIQNIEDHEYHGTDGVLTLPNQVTYGGKTFSVTQLGTLNGSYTFDYTSVVLPSTLEEIDSYACFLEGSVVTIPSSVTQISRLTFDGCMSLSSIHVDNGNTKYKDVEGVLFTADGEELLCYPRAKTAATYNVPNGVKRIGNYAFQGRTELESVTLPESMEYIGEYAFSACPKLKNINLPNTITEISGAAFQNCEVLESIILPENLKNIGFYAFDGCIALTEINLPTSLEYLPYHVFVNCPLTKITSKIFMPVPTDNPFDYDTYSSATLYVPTGTKEYYEQSIGWNDFQTVEELDMTGIDMETYKYSMFTYTITSENTVSIGAKNTGLVGKLIIPDYVTLKGKQYRVNSVIGKLNCINVTSIIIPETMDTITSAFSYCPSLERVYISKSVKWIWNSFNDGCDKLKEIIVDKDNSYYKVIDGVLYSSDMKQLAVFPAGNGISEYKIPEGVKNIDQIFRRNTTLTSVVIPSTIQFMSQTFWDCINLKNVILTHGLKELDGAFYGCTSLEEITIPESVKTIWYDAFVGCAALRKITVKRKTPPNEYDTYEPMFDPETFENATLYVPTGSKSLYEANALWTKFKHIEEIDMPKSVGNGNANADGYIDEKDVNTIADNIMGNVPEDPYEFNEYSADLNGDGKVDVADIVELNNLLKEQ